jgi:chloramphenicol-sensitive protein RarD
MKMPPAENRDTKQGFLLAGGAYLAWGFLPFYMKALAHVPSWEVVAHRILWSIPLSLVILYFLGLLPGLKKAFSSPRTLMMGALTASIISVNWGVYVWAVGSGRALETALGYYINPLFSVFLAAVLLGERLNRLQMLAILFAIIAVAILTWDARGLPWVSLALTFSWGAYAYFKKTLPVGPTEGFLLEILILALPALVYTLWLASMGEGHFHADGGYDMWLLAGTGLVTAIPLILYANGAKRLTLTTIAIMQYSAPTMIFLIAVFAFKEPFSTAKLAAFGFIWAALAVYSWSLFKARGRSARLEPAE